MQIFLNGKGIGEIAPTSIYNLRGPSYVHLNKCIREHLGLNNCVEFFDTMRDAYDWLLRMLPEASVMEYQYDWLEGHCKTIHELI